MTRVVEVGKLKIGGDHPMALICGPCVIEDEKTMMTAAERICAIAEKLGFPLIFKSSYLKDNRSSELSYQGPGLKAGLALLRKIKLTAGKFTRFRRFDRIRQRSVDAGRLAQCRQRRGGNGMHGFEMTHQCAHTRRADARHLQKRNQRFKFCSLQSHPRLKS